MHHEEALVLSALSSFQRRYLLDDGALAPARMVGHLDGKRYLRQEARIALEASERAKASMSAHADSDSHGPVVDEITRACSCYRHCHGGS